MKNYDIDGDLKDQSDEVFLLAEEYLGLSESERVAMCDRIRNRNRAQTNRWFESIISQRDAGDGVRARTPAVRPHAPAAEVESAEPVHLRVAPPMGVCACTGRIPCRAAVEAVPDDGTSASFRKNGTSHSTAARWSVGRCGPLSDPYQLVGKTMGKYTVTELLDSGGMGVVYRAEDKWLQRKVAIKLLPVSHLSDTWSHRRFVHEARAVAKLEHPNICTIYEIDESGIGTLYIVMPLYDGEMLQKKLDRGPLSLREVFRIGVQLAKGLAFAHSRGVVHRDIKPSNVLITGDKIVKIIDFGIARIDGATLLTTSGRTMGTPVYMSPEQINGQEVDHRADIWSLGVILYEALTGLRPFRGEIPPAVMYSILNETPPPIRSCRADVPQPVIDVVMKCLQKDRQDRYASAADIAKDLRAALTAGSRADRPCGRGRVSTTAMFRHWHRSPRW